MVRISPKEQGAETSSKSGWQLVEGILQFRKMRRAMVEQTDTLILEDEW